MNGQIVEFVDDKMVYLGNISMERIVDDTIHECKCTEESICSSCLDTIPELNQPHY